ncbi:hypothetical protein AAG570_005776 [Ranatra chinensis]|uniref:Uncharacterized protein n=1 Tax=Ranatra chinensis TaxID=642074 RepID=A0ABD0XYI8_9HEMI
MADEPGVIYVKKGGFMPNFLYDNGSIEMPLGDVIESCKLNKSSYTTFGLKHIFDIEQATDPQKWTDLKAKIDEINVRSMDLQVLTPTLNANLRDLFQGLSVNLTTLRIQLSGPVANKDLESFANQLESVSSQISDLSIATHLETLASRSRRIISSHIESLEEQKERLIYRLTALELKVGPLQRQVNQSLAHLKTIQYFINNQWSTIAHQNVKDYAARLNSYLDQFHAYLKEAIDGSGVSCAPIWELFHATRILLCKHIVDPIVSYFFLS